MRRRTWLSLGTTLCGFVLIGGVAAPAVGATTTLVNESFTSIPASPSSWVLPAASVAETNGACLTTTDTGTTPIPRCGSAAGSEAGLQLTTNSTTQEGGVAYSSSVPSSLGLDVRFTSYQYGGTGADGITFFLAASDPTNASASPLTLGPPGGNLGYSANGGTSGLTHGYLGIGLDVYGNYASSAFAGSGCTDSTGFTPEAVDVRGPGNGPAGYCLLNHAAGGALDSATPQPVPVEVAVNPTDGPLPSTGSPSFSVPAHSYVVNVTPVGASSPVSETGTLPSAAGSAPASWLDSNNVPEQLSFGWTGSTGSVTDYHTIRDAVVQTLNGTPPRLTVGLSDNSGGTGHSGDTVTYTAAVAVNDANESRPITLTDTFPTGLTPQLSNVSGTGWDCSTSSGQTVTCTHPSAATGPLPSVAMPVTVDLPANASPTQLSDTATAGSPDATQGSDTDNQTYSGAPSATTLVVTDQPVDSQVNTPMQDSDGNPIHVRVAAETTPGGTVDTTYTGNVTLSFDNNPGDAEFVEDGTPTPTLTATAVNGVADFSPIVINAVGFGDTLSATADGLTSATTDAFDVNSATTGCPAGQTCTVNAGTQGQQAVIQAQPGDNDAVITASYGGNVAPIYPCKGTSEGILTFSGNRPKLITLTLQSPPSRLPVFLFCYGQPTPFRTLSFRMSTHFNPANQDYEGLLPPCRPQASGPCVKSVSFRPHKEIAVIFSGAADPHLSH